MKRGKMERIMIELPDEYRDDLDQYRDRLREVFLLGLRDLKAQEALILYTQGVVSFARAAELAGIDRDAFARQARVAGTGPRWSATMVAEELA